MNKFLRKARAFYCLLLIILAFFAINTFAQDLDEVTIQRQNC